VNKFSDLGGYRTFSSIYPTMVYPHGTSWVMRRYCNFQVL